MPGQRKFSMADMAVMAWLEATLTILMDDVISAHSAFPGCLWLSFPWLWFWDLHTWIEAGLAG